MEGGVQASLRAGSPNLLPHYSTLFNEVTIVILHTASRASFQFIFSYGIF